MSRDEGEAPRRARNFARPRVRLHVITGKGGTGKTTVAAALALALASDGQRVLVTEVEDRQGLAQVFDTPPLAYGEELVATAPGGGEVYGMSVEPRQALLEYLDLYYHMGPAGRTLEKIGAIDFATTVAPGLRDVLLTGKIYEAAKRQDGQRFAYDAVVLDGPPTGRITSFLDVTNEVAGLARVGPIHRQAQSIATYFRSPATAVHLVTPLESMPAQETVEAIEELTAAGIPLGSLIVNLTQANSFRAADVTTMRSGALRANRLAAVLAAAGETNPAVAEALVAEATDVAEVVAHERTARRMLRDVGMPMFRLPVLASGVDVAGLHELARILRRQGVE